MKVLSRTLAVLAAFTVAAMPAIASGQDLPEARAVLNKFAEATGAKALEAAPGVFMRGRVELPSAGLSGSVESYMDRTGRSLQVMVMEGIGEMKQGTSTDFGWSLDPVSGARILSDKEYADRRDSESIAGMLRQESMITEARTLARTTIDGQPCVQLMIKWKSGRQSSECYSESTGLLVSITSTQASAMGDIPYSSSLMDYKTVNGVTLPMRVVQRLAAQEFTIRFSEVRIEAIDPVKLALPSEIQALRR